MGLGQPGQGGSLWPEPAQQPGRHGLAWVWPCGSCRCPWGCESGPRRSAQDTVPASLSGPGLTARSRGAARVLWPVVADRAGVPAPLTPWQEGPTDDGICLRRTPLSRSSSGLRSWKAPGDARRGPGRGWTCLGPPSQWRQESLPCPVPRPNASPHTQSLCGPSPLSLPSTPRSPPPACLSRPHAPAGRGSYGTPSPAHT